MGVDFIDEWSRLKKSAPLPRVSPEQMGLIVSIIGHLGTTEGVEHHDLGLSCQDRAVEPVQTNFRC